MLMNLYVLVTMFPIRYVWRGLHWVDVLSRCDSGGGSERGKKGFGSVALRQVIEKALPLPSPDTLVMPSQRATERTPEMGIEEDVVNTNSSQGVRSEDTNANSECLALGVVMIPSFCWLWSVPLGSS